MADTAQDLTEPPAEPELEAPPGLLPGILAGALLGELEQAVEAITKEGMVGWDEKAAAATTLANLAAAANAVDAIMRRGDADHAGPVVAPDLLRRAAGQMGRVAQMLLQAVAARGRFTTDDQPDELTTGPWAEVRILPDGYEDVDPAAIARLATELLQAAGPGR